METGGTEDTRQWVSKRGNGSRRGVTGFVVWERTKTHERVRHRRRILQKRVFHSEIVKSYGSNLERKRRFRGPSGDR